LAVVVEVAVVLDVAALTALGTSTREAATATLNARALKDFLRVRRCFMDNLCGWLIVMAIVMTIDGNGRRKGAGMRPRRTNGGPQRIPPLPDGLRAPGPGSRYQK
jgi:hypothetical protein